MPNRKRQSAMTGPLLKEILVSATRDSLNRWTAQAWQTLQLEPYLPADRMAVEGMMTIDTRNRLHIVITALCPDQVAGCP